MFSYAILLLTSLIWGLAFVAQRKGAENLDPLTFNALRFALGALFVWGFKVASRIVKKNSAKTNNTLEPVSLKVGSWKEPVFLGVLLFCAASLQQLGMQWTSAGSAGFITGLYVLFVPLIGSLRGQRIRRYMVIAIILSLVGLGLMNRTADLNVSLGNLFVLCSALFWAFHVQMVDKLSKEYRSLDLALVQYSVCTVISVFGALIYRLVLSRGDFGFEVLFNHIKSSGVPIIYAGVMSVGVAFTLQIQAQKKVKPQAASVILCLEGVFAMLGGYFLLQESVSVSALFGAVFLLSAMLISVINDRKEFLIDKNSGLKN